MKHTRFSTMLFATAFVCSLAAATMIPAFAQSKQARNPGSDHGEQDFPMSRKRYYAYTEWTRIMQDLQTKYSLLADIQSIGKSRMGRDQYLLTITSKATGKAGTKPAMWVDGAIHGNEVNGITCSLYLAWYLLTRYDYDPSVHDLVDRTTFYMLGAYSYLIELWGSPAGEADLNNNSRCDQADSDACCWNTHAGSVVPAE